VITQDIANGAVTPAKLSADAQYMGFKNRIINGGMVIDQRNAGASVTGATSDPYITDRWKTPATQNSKFTFQQNAGSVTPPAGYTNYLGATSSSAYSVISTDFFTVSQLIEGLNTADLGWGAAGAATVTLSFWVCSSLTGTFGGSIVNSGQNRSYPFTYTISAANTWEQKSITIAGDTSGTWLTTNGIGIRVGFSLGAGSTYTGTSGAWAGAAYYGATGQTNVVGTSGATLYITGVQLEKGSTATSFDYRPYGTELALCQRYFISYGGTAPYERMAVGLCNGTTTAAVCTFLPVPMRTAPTLGYSSAGNFGVYDGGNVYTVTSLVLDGPTPQVVNYSFGVASGLTQYRPAQIVANNTTSARLTLSAEL
jgi:hypothetical protein